MPTGVYVRRRLRKNRKKKKKSYVAPPSPSRRNTPWVCVCIRAEHYAMLRELGKFYEKPLSSLAATLITDQFLKVLETINPVQARQLREELRHEKNSKNTVNLDLPS